MFKIPSKTCGCQKWKQCYYKTLSKQSGVSSPVYTCQQEVAAVGGPCCCPPDLQHRGGRPMLEAVAYHGSEPASQEYLSLCCPDILTLPLSSSLNLWNAPPFFFVSLQGSSKDSGFSIINFVWGFIYLFKKQNDRGRGERNKDLPFPDHSPNFHNSWSWVRSQDLCLGLQCEWKEPKCLDHRVLPPWCVSSYIKSECSIATMPFRYSGMG